VPGAVNSAHHQCRLKRDPSDPSDRRATPTAWSNAGATTSTRAPTGSNACSPTNRELATPELVDLAVDTLAPDSPDDVVACAVCFPVPDAQPAAGL